MAAREDEVTVQITVRTSLLELLVQVMALLLCESALMCQRAGERAGERERERARERETEGDRGKGRRRGLEGEGEG